MLKKLSQILARLLPPPPIRATNQFAEQALEKHKAEGMRLAVQARMIAVIVVLILMPILVPRWEVLYFMAFTLLFALIGWAQLRVAQVGRSQIELMLLFLDFLLLTIVLVVPNPFATIDAPLETQFRFNGHSFFYVYLALGTLAYSWRTVRGYISFGTIFWVGGIAYIWFMSSDHPTSALVQNALVDYPLLKEVVDPGNIRLDVRLQEIVIFGLVAFILSITVRRFHDLLFEHAAMERERTNLARYFSPNMVEEFSNNDEPLTHVKTQNVAVLFVDIIGFTTYANNHEPDEVITTLREFHGLMEKCVFDNHGTLDKFLGDGMMVTFGTPIETERDAQNCFACAQAMVKAVKTWNANREGSDKPKLKIGVGIHYGPCVLGDIGGENRLEFAVIGDTVNLASRVEAKTRELKVDIAMTEAISDKLNGSGEPTNESAFSREEFDNLTIRGINEPIKLIGVNMG